MMRNYSPVFKCWFAAIMCLFFLSNQASAQCGTNTDFSLGNFTGWTGTWSDGACQGSFLGICECSIPEPLQNNGIVQGPNNGSIMDTAHHYIMTSGYDSIIGGTTLPVVFPGGTGKSARLGNASVSTSTNDNDPADAETVSRTFYVTLENSLFIYNSSIIINDGGHPPGQQAFFQVSGVTSAGDTIPEAAYYVDGTTCHTIGGFGSTSYTPAVYYKRWSADTINLYKYIGQTVTITFITSSCKPDGCAGTHFAYAYLSCGCGKGPVPPIVVSSSVGCGNYHVTLTAPATATSYAWSGPGIIAGANAQVATADTAGLYIVRLVLPDLSVVYDSVTIGPGRVSNTALSNSICSGDTFNFYGRKLTASGIYADTFTSIYSGCDSVITLNLTVIPNITATVSLNANPPVPCNGETVTFTAVSNITGTSYYFIQNSTPVNSLITDSVYSVTVHSGDVWLCEIAPGTGCYANTYALSDSFIVDSLHSLNIVAAVPGCPVLDTLKASGNFYNGESLLWYHDTSLVSNNPALTDSSYINPVVGTYFAQVKDSNGCIANSAVVTVAPDTVSVLTITTTSPACPNSTAVFTASPAHNTTAATYQWLVNSVAMGTNSPVFSTAALTNNDAVYCILTTNAQCGNVETATSNRIVITGDSMVTPTLQLTANFTTFCSGSFILTSVTGTNTGTAPKYRWYMDDTLLFSSTQSGYASTDLNNKDSLYVVMDVSDICATVDSAVSNKLHFTVEPIVTPSVTITASPTGAICNGASITFTPHAVNGGSFTIYHWYKNGTCMAANTGIYTFSSLNNNDVIRCELLPTVNCPSVDSVSSNSDTIKTLVQPSISITGPSGALCQGTGIVFTSTVTNGGSTPAYQWRMNGTNIPGATLASYNFTVLAATDTFTCLVSASGCASDTTLSNPLIVDGYSNTAPILTITAAPASPVCQGTPVTFSSSITNGGPSPSYQWFVNNQLVQNGGASYGTYSLVNGAVIYCEVMKPSCAGHPSGNSDSLTFTVNPNLTPSVTIQASPSGTICAGTNVIFTASGLNTGSQPTYHWTLNGGAIADVSSSYANSSLHNGDIIKCVLQSDYSCLLSNNVSSNADTVTVLPVVTPAVTISGLQPYTCKGSVALFTASTTGGSIAPVYQWRVNGINTGITTDTFSSSSLINGDTILCLLNTNQACTTVDSALSNALGIVVFAADTPTITIAASETTGICAGTIVSFTASTVNAGSSPVYQWQLNGQAVGLNIDSISTGFLNNTDTVVCTLNSSNACALNPAISNQLILHITPIVTSSYAQSICAGGTYNFNGTHLTTAGIYKDTLNSAVTGCDSVVTLNLTVIQIDSTYLSHSVCEGHSYNFNGTLVSSAGVYSKTLSSVTTGCDSVVILTLTVNPVITTSISQSVCAGHAFNFNGTQLSVAGTYYDTLASTVTGCDSIVKLTLSVGAVVTSSYSNSICAGSSYIFNGHLLTASGNYADTLPSSVSGCDSIVTLTLTVNPLLSTIITKAVCPGHSYNFNGTLLSTAGSYHDTLTSLVTGCDSIVTLTLTVNPALSTSITQSVCAGHSYNFNGTAISSAGTYRDTLTSLVTGCDSIAILTLMVDPVLSTSITQSVCAGHSYNFNGTLLSIGGTYHDTLTSVVTGCDSIVTLTLTFNPSITTALSQSVCAGHSYNFNGTPVSLAGTYRDTLTSRLTGCDSIVVLTLQVGNTVTSSISQTICAGSSYSFGGFGLTAAGNYNDTLASSISGCDSEVTLTLTVVAPDTSSVYGAICAGSSYIFNGTGLSAAGNYKDTLTSSTTGCDSIVTLHLTVTAYPVIAAPADTMLCPASSLILNSSAGGAVISWGSGYTNGQTVTLNQTTQFTVSANAAGCITTDTFTATVLPEKVWPGDANEDLIANNYDILSIGIAFGATGGLRPDASLNWQEQCAPAWPDSFINGTNYAFADCNGDGIVNYADTEAVSLNYGLVHQRSNNNQQTGMLPLIVKTNASAYLPGETVSGQVLLGTSAIPASGVYGIAYTLDAGTFAKPNTLQVSQASSWMLGANNQIVFGRSTGTVTMDIAQTRINHVNVPGYGVIANFSFVLDSALTNGSTTIIATNTALCLNNLGDTILLDNINDTISVLVNGISNIAGNKIGIYPNPTNGTLIITLNAPVAAAPVAEVYDELGQVILTAILNHNTTALNLSPFARGFYYVKVSSANTVITTQKVCLMK
jgi:hypothetical protein